jgi:hypothetical protein
MDRGAAAREKNGANNLATNDRDNHQASKPSPQKTPNNDEKALPGLGANRARKKPPGGP